MRVHYIVSDPREMAFTYIKRMINFFFFLLFTLQRPAQNRRRRRPYRRSYRRPRREVKVKSRKVSNYFSLDPLIVGSWLDELAHYVEVFSRLYNC